MALSSDAIDRIVTDASEAMQLLQHQFGRDNVPAARVRFSRGFLRTAAECRSGLPNLGTEVQRCNASYGLMTVDIFRWLVIRTDLSGAALSMIVKESIAVYGAMCEWLAKEALHGNGKGKPYVKRTEKLVELGILDQALKDELNWIWDVRCNEHFHEVTSLEH